MRPCYTLLLQYYLLPEGLTLLTFGCRDTNNLHQSRTISVHTMLSHFKYQNALLRFNYQPKFSTLCMLTPTYTRTHTFARFYLMFLYERSGGEGYHRGVGLTDAVSVGVGVSVGGTRRPLCNRSHRGRASGHGTRGGLLFALRRDNNGHKSAPKSPVTGHPTQSRPPLLNLSTLILSEKQFMIFSETFHRR